jgi:hypothetical protein
VDARLEEFVEANLGLLLLHLPTLPGG